MRSGWKTLGMATLVTAAIITTGCGGVNATGSVSPLMFIMPGLGQTGPAPVIDPVQPVPSETDSEPIHVAIHLD